jgi:hypothetical protein
MACTPSMYLLVVRVLNRPIRSPRAMGVVGRPPVVAPSPTHRDHKHKW